MTDKVLTETYARLIAIEETRDDSSLHDAAIDLLDDMLANEQYSEKADVLRYAIKRLQEVGLGR